MKYASLKLNGFILNYEASNLMGLIKIFSTH